MENIPWWAPLVAAVVVIVLALIGFLVVGDWGKNIRREAEIEAIKIHNHETIE